MRSLVRWNQAVTDWLAGRLESAERKSARRNPAARPGQEQRPNSGTPHDMRYRTADHCHAPV